MKINYKLKQTLAIMLAIMMIFGVMDLSLIKSVFADGSEWTDNDFISFKERTIEEDGLVYIEIESINDILLSMGLSKNANIGQLDSQNIGKWIILHYDGNEPLELLQNENVIALGLEAMNVVDYLYENESSNLDLSNIKYVGDDGLGGLFELMEIPYSISGMDNLVYIGIGVFAGAKLPNKLNLNSAVYINDYAFVHSNLRYLTIGNSISYIGTGAFAENRLINIQINGSPVIANGAFNGNQVMPEDAFITNADGELVSYAGIVRMNIEIPDNITKIHLRAISGIGINRIDLNNVNEVYIESDEYDESYDFQDLDIILVGDNVELYIVDILGQRTLFGDDNFNINYNEHIADFFSIYDQNSRTAGEYYYNWDGWEIMDEPGGPIGPGEPGDETGNFVIDSYGTITSYTGNSRHLIIPSEIGGATVVNLGQMFTRYNLPDIIEVEGDINEVNFGLSNYDVDTIIFHGNVNTIRSNSLDDIGSIEFRGDVGRIEYRAFYSVEKLTFLGNVQTLNNQFIYSYSQSSYSTKITIGEDVNLPYYSYSDKFGRFISKYGTNPAAGEYGWYYDRSHSYSTEWISFIENNVEFAGGKGTKEEPFLISEIEHFENALEIFGDYHFKQIADLDFTDYNYEEYAYFVDKVYDGNNFTIKNISQTDVNYSSAYSIFGTVINSEISNLNIKDVNITLRNVGENNIGILGKKLEKSFINNISLSDINVNLKNIQNAENIGIVAGYSEYTKTKNVRLNNINVDLQTPYAFNYGTLYGFAEGYIHNNTPMSTFAGDFDEYYNLPDFIGQITANNLVINVVMGNDDFEMTRAMSAIGGLVGVSQDMIYTDIKMSNSSLNTDGSIAFAVGGSIGMSNNSKMSNVNNNVNINALAVSVGGLVGSSLNIDSNMGGGEMRSMSMEEELVSLYGGSSNFSDVTIRGNIVNKTEYYPIHYMIQDMGGHIMYNPLTQQPINPEVFSGTGGLLGMAINTNVSNIVINLSELEGPVNVGGTIGSAHNVEIEDIEILTDIKISMGEDRLPRRNTGGFIGYGEFITAVGIDYIGTVYGQSNSGGLLGKTLNSLISKTDTTATVKGTNNVGGIAGYSENTSINKTNSLSTINGLSNIGGIIGDSFRSKIYRANMFQTTVEGENIVGGFIGNSKSDTIMESKMAETTIKSLNLPTGNMIGKLTELTKVINSYLKTTDAVNKSTVFDGLVGQVKDEFAELDIINMYVSSESGTNKIYKDLDENVVLDYANMKEQANYTDLGFDFNSIWKQSASKNNKLPFLWWEYPDNNEELGDAYLSSLDISDGELVPEFNKENNYYEVKLPNYKETITIFAAGEDNGTIILNGETFETQKTINLETGTNIVSIKVSSADGIKTNVYTLNIINNNTTNLTGLEIEDVVITPEFDPGHTDYEATITETTNTITIKTETSSDNDVYINGVETVGESTVVDNLVPGLNIVTIRVVSKDKSRHTVYIIKVNKPGATTNLTDLEIEDVVITPEFDPEHTDYEATVTETTNTITIKTETSSENDIYINGEQTIGESTVVDNLVPGLNVVTIRVVSKDKTKHTVYVIKVNKTIIKSDIMITYFPNNIEWGNTTRKVEYISEEAVKGSTAEPKDGYLFKHWETIDGEIVSTNKTLIPANKAEVFIAMFEPNIYTVNFLNRAGDIINTQQIKHKNSAIAPTPPIEEEMLFLNWSSNAYLEVTSDLEIQAIYKEQGKYIVTYNSNGADEEAFPRIQQVLEGNSGVGQFPEPPIKMGYKFIGWNTNSTGAGLTFTTTTPVDKDIEVFAQYVPFFISISANPNIIVADGESTSIITVILKDENGIPIRNALVEIDAEYGTFPEGSATVTDMYGTARIRFQSEEIKSTTRTNVKVVATVTDRVNGLYGTAEISMIFEPSYISGVVLDKNNNAIEGAKVTISEPEINFYAETTTNALGRYSIPVAEGNRIYNIQITKPIIVNNTDVDMTFEQKATVGDISGDKLEIVSADKTLTGIIKVKDTNKRDEITGEIGGMKIQVKQRNNGVLETAGQVDQDTGIFTINNVDKNKEYILTIVTAEGKEVIVGKFAANVEAGQMKIQEELIDPYGTIRNSFTKNIVGNAEVKLYFADTARNRAKGNIPNTLVPLPLVSGFLPSDNRNPQNSTPTLVFNNDVNVMDHGNYAWLVFPEADYYIIGTHIDYFDYDSRNDANLVNGLITVEWDIVKHNFEMKPLRTTEDLQPNERIVTFVDWDDSVIKKEIVKLGGNAIAPANPIRQGYRFTGWDKSFTNIQTDLVVKALYEKLDKPVDPVVPDPVDPVIPGPINPRPPYIPGPGPSYSDEQRYQELKAKLDNLIPYTILKDTKIDINEITGIDKADLSYELDTSIVGRTILKANLMGRHLEYKLEVVDLVRNTLIFMEKPNHWAMEYARYSIDKGFIIGYTDGSIGLDNILTYSESFTALDRLLLKNGLVELNLSRTIIEDNTNIPESKWYHYTVKSILSKYTEKEKIVGINYETPISREEIAQILYNSFNGKFKENKMLANYVDEVEISNKTAVQFAYNTGLMIGMPDGKFAPKKTLTRAEFMTILTRLDQMLSENTVE